MGPRETYKSLSQYMKALASRIEGDKKTQVAKILENERKLSTMDMELF